jgi:hypothetical protein
LPTTQRFKALDETSLNEYQSDGGKVFSGKCIRSTELILRPASFTSPSTDKKPSAKPPGIPPCRTDWIIDLGPEGGGEIVASGPPEAIVAEKRSFTGAVSQAGSGAAPGGGEEEKSRGGGVSD